MNIPVYQRNEDGIIYDDNGIPAPMLDMKGQAITVPGKFMAGMRFKARYGIFLFKDGNVSGRNKRYSDFLEMLGIEIKQKETDSGLSIPVFGRLEDRDVLGEPVIVRLDYELWLPKEERDKPKDEQRWAKTLKVFDMLSWTDGVSLSPEEVEDDLPF